MVTGRRRDARLRLMMRGVPPPRMPCTRPTLIRTSRPCRGRSQVQKLLAVFSAEDPGSELRPAALASEEHGFRLGRAAPAGDDLVRRSGCGAPGRRGTRVQLGQARAPVENPGPGLASGRSPARTPGPEFRPATLVRDFRCCFCWRRRRFESFRDMSPRRYPDRSEQHCRHDRGPFARARRPARTRCRAPVRLPDSSSGNLRLRIPENGGKTEGSASLRLQSPRFSAPSQLVITNWDCPHSPRRRCGS